MTIFDSNQLKQTIIEILDNPGVHPDWQVECAKIVAGIMGRSAVREGRGDNFNTPHRSDECCLDDEEKFSIFSEGFRNRETK